MRTNDFYYRITVDPSKLFSGVVSGHCRHYREELERMFGRAASYCSEQTFFVTQQQLARFFYLRCALGKDNGVKNLNMTRRPNNAPIEHGITDLRANCESQDECANMACQSASRSACEDPDKAVKLAKQLQLTDQLLKEIHRGGTLCLGELPLNSEHMKQVLTAQRNALRQQVIQAITPPPPAEAVEEVIHG